MLYYMISFSKELDSFSLHKERFPWSQTFSTNKDFSMIKKVFHRQTFSQTRNFSTSKNVYYKVTFFLDRGSLPVGKFSTSQIFILNQEFFPQAKTFSTSQHFSLIKELLYKQKIFLQAKTFTWSRRFSIKSFPSSWKFCTS